MHTANTVPLLKNRKQMLMLLLISSQLKVMRCYFLNHFEYWVRFVKQNTYKLLNSWRPRNTTSLMLSLPCPVLVAR